MRVIAMVAQKKRTVFGNVLFIEVLYQPVARSFSPLNRARNSGEAICELVCGKAGPKGIGDGSWLLSDWSPHSYGRPAALTSPQSACAGYQPEPRTRVR